MRNCVSGSSLSSLSSSLKQQQQLGYRSRQQYFYRPQQQEVMNHSSSSSSSSSSRRRGISYRIGNNIHRGRDTGHRKGTTDVTFMNDDTIRVKPVKRRKDHRRNPMLLQT